MQNNSESQETFDQQHEYITYGRRFNSYRWYKPILVGVLTAIFAMVVVIGAIFASIALGFLSDVKPLLLQTGYDNMDVSSVGGILLNLGGLAVFIPALWLAAKIVRDRPFSSYSSSRGGWNWKLFGKCLLIAIVTVGIPAVISNLMEPGDGVNRLTVFTFLLLTVMGPLQCIAEEYLFRAFFLQTLGSWFKIPIVAIVVSAVIFAAGHPYSMAGVLSVLASGLIWGFTAKISRGLEASSAAHITNNMATFYMMGFGMVNLTADVRVTDMIFSIAADFLYLIVIIILTRNTHWFDEEIGGNA